MPKARPRFLSNQFSMRTVAATTKTKAPPMPYKTPEKYHCHTEVYVDMRAMATQQMTTAMLSTTLMLYLGRMRATNG